MELQKTDSQEGFLRGSCYQGPLNFHTDSSISQKQPTPPGCFPRRGRFLTWSYCDHLTSITALLSLMTSTLDSLTWE